MIEAKPIVANRYWILKDHDRKVGTVEVDDQGVRVRIAGTVRQFRTVPMARRAAQIDFQPPMTTTRAARDSVHGYATGCRVHNAMWDVRRRLPLFTKTTRSKSWYAAGWYWICQHRRWKLERNPKLIILDRYQFQGPFTNREAAGNQPVL